jgi:ferritin-like metal-binding protein YciE
MSTPQTLKDIYADEIKDLWSANDQMAKVVKVMATKAGNAELKRVLEKSVSGISQHADSLKKLLSDAGEDVRKEHCKGMEGLAAEATKHMTQEAPPSGDLLDTVIIAQYQRMSHYGLAGFGTAAAYARALGLDDHAQTLASMVNDIHEADEFASHLAERAEKAVQAHA